MSFPDDILNEKEEVVFYQNPHWLFLGGAIIMIASALFMFVVITVYNSNYYWIGLLLVLFAFLGSTGRYLRWKTTQYVLTTEKLVMREGIFTKKSVEIPLSQITNTSFSQTIWERVVKMGDIVIESAGESGHQVFLDVANPQTVKNMISKAIDDEDKNDRQESFTEALSLQHKMELKERDQTKSNSPIDQIEQLDILRQKGVLTQEEFDVKKRELLDRL